MIGVLKYMSGDTVEEGDVVTINGFGIGRVIDLILNDNNSGRHHYYSSFGPGVLFEFEKVGRVYYPAEDIPNEEDILFISRRGDDESATI